MIFSEKKHVVAILSGIFLLYFIALFLLAFGTGIARPRIVVPVLPALALMSAAAVYSLGDGTRKKRGVCYFVIAGAVIFFIQCVAGGYFIDYKAKRKIRVVKDILEIIDQRAQKKDKVVVVLLSSGDFSEIDSTNYFFNYFSIAKYPHISMETYSLSINEEMFNPVAEKINRAEYLIIMDKNPVVIMEKIAHLRTKKIKHYIVEIKDGQAQTAADMLVLENMACVTETTGWKL